MSNTQTTSQPAMTDVTIYSTQFCPYCVAAKRLLNSKGIEYKEIDVSNDPEKRREMEEISRRRTVPQIFADGKHIGGFTDLAAYFGE